MQVVGKGRLTLEAKVIRGDGKGGVLEVEDLGVIASSDPAVEMPAPPVLREGDVLDINVST
jgi:hypothetical protein